MYRPAPWGLLLPARDVVGACVAVSRFFCFPTRMNFAESEKRPTKPPWRAASCTGLGGYMRGGLRVPRAASSAAAYLCYAAQGGGVALPALG